MHRRHRDGVRGDPRPFFLPGQGAAGVLLLHGFTGTPFEMSLLGRALADRGFSVAAPLLAGHGLDVRALAATGWPEWLASAEAALLDLEERLRGAPLAVVGLSMGGLLALELCRRHPDRLRAACFLSTPLWLPSWQMRGIAALGRLRGISLPKLAGSDVWDQAMGRANPATPRMPVTSLLSLCELMDAVRRRLGQIDRPALLAHAVHDHTAPYACLGELARGLGTPRADLRCLSLPRSFHLITLDVEREVLFAAIGDHLARCLGAPHQEGQRPCHPPS